MAVVSNVSEEDALPPVGNAVEGWYANVPAPERVPFKVSVPTLVKVSVLPLAIESVSPEATLTVPETVRSEVPSVLVPADMGSMVRFVSVFPPPTSVAEVLAIVSVTPASVVPETKVTFPDEVALPEIVGEVAPVKSIVPNWFEFAVKVCEEPFIVSDPPDSVVHVPAVVSILEVVVHVLVPA